MHVAIFLPQSMEAFGLFSIFDFSAHVQKFS